MAEATGAMRNSDPIDNRDDSQDAAALVAQVVDSDATAVVTPVNDEPESPEEIRASIEQTRHEISDTINALQEKLDPGTLKEKVKDQVREQVHEQVQVAKDTAKEAAMGKAGELMQSAKETLSHAGEAISHATESLSEAARPAVDAVADATRPAVETVGRAASAAGDTASRVGHAARETGSTIQTTGGSLIDTVRQNPIPAAMAAIGIGWLLVNGNNNRSHPTYSSNAYSPDSYRSNNYASTAYSSGETTTTSLSRAQDSVGDRVSDRVGDVRETASHLTDTARDQAGHVVGQAREHVSHVGETIQHQAHHGQDRLQNTLQDSPLAVGAVALALGAAVGLMVPQTRPEQELMGEARDRLVDTAHSAAHDTVQKVQHVAQRVVEEAGQVAKTAAQEQGLTGG